MNSAEYMGVYVIESNGIIKIGVASNLISRLLGMQGQCPTEIKLIHFIQCNTKDESHKLEVNMHETAKTWRLHGEWFNILDKFNTIFPQYDSVDTVLINKVNSILSGCYNCLSDNNDTSCVASKIEFTYSPGDYTVRTDDGLVEVSVMSDDIYEFLSDHSASTFEEIRTRFDMSVGDTKRCLNYMKSEGLIDSNKTRHRPMLYFIIN